MSRLHDGFGLRRCMARWVIIGELRLESAAHLGGEVVEGVADMCLLWDLAGPTPRALLTGASLAGGLRSHLLDRSVGYADSVAQDRDDRSAVRSVAALLGGEREDPVGGQSALIVFDSLALEAGASGASEIRDGVAISHAMGTAQDHRKYDFEVLPPNTVFPLRLELIVGDEAEEASLVESLLTALLGLEEGSIGVGARKSRGLGRCRGGKWRARRYDLRTSAGWLEWLASDHLDPLVEMASVASIDEAIRAAAPTVRLSPATADERSRALFHVRLESRWPAPEGVGSASTGLLIRSPGKDAGSADAVQQTSGGASVLPGTSVGGVLRGRAMRIAHTVRGSEAPRWIDRLFGHGVESKAPPARGASGPRGSRIRVSENAVQGGVSVRCTRVQIDEFTSGTVDGALFDETPVFGGTAELTIEIRNPKEGEVGLMLLVLKDLLTGDLPIGGTSSVGRGYMCGSLEAVLHNGRSARVGASEPATPEATEILEEQVREFLGARALGGDES